MKEIEILYVLQDPIEEAIRKINVYRQSGASFVHKGTVHVVDDYYVNEKVEGLRFGSGANKSLRVRSKDRKHFITFKDDHYNKGTWLYSDEYETAVVDNDIISTILRKLGCRKEVTVDLKKHIFVLGQYEVVLEEVVGLGNFVEIEIMSEHETDPMHLKEDARRVLLSLGLALGDEMNTGKAELLLKKQNGANKQDLFSRYVAEATSQIAEGGYWQVCGPVTSRGYAQVDQNIKTIKNMIDKLVSDGEKVFDQIQYEPKLQNLIDEGSLSYDDMLEGFYGKIFSTGNIVGIYLLSGWESSYGCRYEEKKAKQLGLKIIYPNDSGTQEKE